MTVGVYIIENTLNGNFYIGSSEISIENRWKDHLNDLRGNRHHSQRLQNSFNKHGESNFQMRILAECAVEEAIRKEQFFMDTWEPEFNMNPTAGNCSGRKFTEETKQKMSLSAKKRGLNPFLINQQKSKVIINQEGQKQCSNCLVFKPIEQHNTKRGNKCKECVSISRPCRKLKNPKKVNKPVIAISNYETLEFEKMIDAETFFKNKGLTFNRASLRNKLNKEEIYHGYIWRSRCL